MNRLADDRASQLSDDDVEHEIQRRLREEARSRGDIAKIHPCVESGDIPDETEAHLVILGPTHAHSARDGTSAARKAAASVLESRGNSPRNYKNTLVFLAADTNRLRELEQAVRQFLAWSSIWDDHIKLNLDQFQSSLAATKRKAANETVDARIPETYQWLIVPGQPDPQGQPEWTEYRLQGEGALAARASRKLKTEELLMVDMGGSRLRHEVDRIPLWRGDHVPVRQLCEDMARYLYLPRIKNEGMILSAIREATENKNWQQDGLAYADSWDEQKSRYRGLRLGQAGRVAADPESLVVKPDVAFAQLETEQTQATDGSPADPVDHKWTGGPGKPSPSGGPVKPGGTVTPTPTLAPVLRRFHGSVALNAIRAGNDVSKIGVEVLSHLAGIVGADVQVTLDIQAVLPEGASDKLVRDVTENCRTLGFKDYGFEEC